MKLIAIIVIIFLMYLLIPKQQIFLTSNQSYKILKKDEDDYFKSLLSRHLASRKSKNVDEYFSKIQTLNFTNLQEERIKKCMAEADIFLKDYHLTSKIPWKIALSRGKTYEFGYPHTRIDTIFISDDIFNENDIYITRALIHEKYILTKNVIRQNIIKY